MSLIHRFSSYRLPQHFLRRCFSSSKNNAVAPPKFNNFVNSTNFIIDTNGHLKREKLFEKEVNGKWLTYEKAVPEDLPLIIDFYSTYFNQNEVLTATLKITEEESKELFTEITKSSETFMLRDGNKFVGMGTTEKIEMKEFPKEKVHLMHEKDYGKFIDSGPFKHRNNNIIYILLEAAEAKIYDHMKFPCVFYHTSLGGVHPKYFAQNIGPLMSLALLAYCKKQGAKYCVGLPTSDASFKLHAKMPGITFADKYRYEDFLDYGSKPFENVIGGNKFAYPFIIDLEKY